MKKQRIETCSVCKRQQKYYCKGMCKTCYCKELVPARWAKRFDVCIVCGENYFPHVAKGLCRRCYSTQETGTLCACGCGLTVPKVGNKIREFRKGHWLRIQGGESSFQKAHKERFTGKNNPQYGKFGKDHPAYGHKTSPEVREMRRKRILKTMSEGKFGKTDIEIILSEILDEIGVYHIPQSLLYEKFTVDEYLPNEGVVVEALGEYWHGDKRKYSKPSSFQISNIKRDASRLKWLTNKGHFVLMLWEKELKTDREWCKKEILSVIKDSALPLI